jgi:hypothetical protein
MFVHALDLNHLLTLPACGEHGAFLPVVDVNGLLIKIIVERSTKVAHLIVIMEFFLFVPILDRLLLFRIAPLRHIFFFLATFLCCDFARFLAA